MSEFPRILVAGCLAGVEGYVEDIATGHLAGLALVALAKGLDVPKAPELTLHGALPRAITNPKISRSGPSPRPLPAPRRSKQRFAQNATGEC